MLEAIEFNADLIKRYDQTGPRYTSYPTAVSFTDDFTEQDYQQAIRHSNEDPIPAPLSLYFHIPFCNTVCFYCGCNKIVTKNYSRATEYLTWLYKEIALQAALFDPDRVVEQLHWGGGTPTFLQRDEMQDLMAETRSHFNCQEDDSRDFSIEIDPRSVSPDDVHFLGDLGFNRYSLGVQDVDIEVQQAVNRIQPVDETRAILNACRDAGGRSINIDLIYGLPLQTTERFAKTLDTVIEMAPDRLSVFNYAHMPHRFKPQRRINVEDLPPAEEKLEILQMAIEKLSAAGYVYIGMDHFALPDDELVQAQARGELHRNFQGYSTHGNCDLIGLGVSSIGKVCDVYSQNVKDVESYKQHLANDKLPVLRGLRLTEDDIIRRSLIQHLTCDFALDIPAFEKRNRLDFADYFAWELNALAAMEKDDLLEISPASIKVKAKGRLLIRNICMPFDINLRTGKNTQSFSRVI
ncbi:MAG TPA: oxygen-independent coproporphyrinogen III oxidase [Chromatiales bacterium]|nr:oxygen-independent coproporphyrinogen III oxidase [Thiotrichales bacterium]HIP69198.1 oxygen-independent coproporphyrinogen III oxidase [Chromatiales bacterium]